MKRFGVPVCASTAECMLIVRPASRRALMSITLSKLFTVDPQTLNIPTLEFVSLRDRIVPAPTSARLPNQRLLGLGHVGMIVGSRAREQLWEPLAAMLSQPQQN